MASRSKGLLGVRRIGILALLLGAIVQATCGGDGKPYLLVTMSGGSGSTVLSLQFTVQTVNQTASGQILGSPTEFGMWLPAGASGNVQVEVKALGQGGCLGAQGNGQTMIAPSGQADLSVTLVQVSCGTGMCQLCGIGMGCAMNTDCESNVCTAKTCAPTCTPGALSCDGAQPQVCNSSGMGFQIEGEECSGGTPVCLNGACVECIPGATQCTDAAHMKTCGSDDQWQNPVVCAPYVCSPTGCTTNCAHDSDCATGPCNTCPLVAKLCLAPLGVGDCKSAPCHPSNSPTCGTLGTFTGGGNPYAIAFDGTNMWVTNPGSDNVTKLSPTGVIVGTFSVGNGPNVIAFDGTNMWVVNSFSDNVTKLSPTGATLGTFAVGTTPSGIAFDGTNMWVANTVSNNVTKLSPTGAILGTFPVGFFPVGIAFDGTNMWVANSAAAPNSSVTKLSPTGATLGTFPVGDRPTAIAFDGTNMWVTNMNDSNVTKLSPTGATLGTFAVGSNPQGIAFDGTNMWIANDGSNNVTKLSPTGTILGTFPVGTEPIGIAFDGTHMWVTGNNVTEL